MLQACHWRDGGGSGPVQSVAAAEHGRGDGAAGAAEGVFWQQQRGADALTRGQAQGQLGGWGPCKVWQPAAPPRKLPGLAECSNGSMTSAVHSWIWRPAALQASCRVAVSEGACWAGQDAVAQACPLPCTVGKGSQQPFRQAVRLHLLLLHCECHPRALSKMQPLEHALCHAPRPTALQASCGPAPMLWKPSILNPKASRTTRVLQHQHQHRHAAQTPRCLTPCPGLQRPRGCPQQQRAVQPQLQHSHLHLSAQPPARSGEQQPRRAGRSPQPDTPYPQVISRHTLLSISAAQRSCLHRAWRPPQANSRQ